MELKEWFNYGVPTALLAMICFGIWKVSNWAKIKVVEPVVKAHLELVEALKDAIPEQNRKLDQVVTTAATVAVAAASVSSESHKQMELLQQTLMDQTGILKAAIEEQTKNMKESHGK